MAITKHTIVGVSNVKGTSTKGLYDNFNFFTTHPEDGVYGVAMGFFRVPVANLVDVFGCALTLKDACDLIGRECEVYYDRNNTVVRVILG